jgi:hypothetical protein
MTTTQTTKAAAHAANATTAAQRVTNALAQGQPVTLADCKVLEAAGCWLRRNAVNDR